MRASRLDDAPVVAPGGPERECRCGPLQDALQHLALGRREPEAAPREREDRKSTRLNSSHGYNSDAVLCLKKKVIKFTPELSRALPFLNHRLRYASYAGLTLPPTSRLSSRPNF